MVLDIERTRSGSWTVCQGFASGGNCRDQFNEADWEDRHPEAAFDNLVSRAMRAQEAAERARRKNLLNAARHYEKIARSCEERATALLNRAANGR